jgi:hypothetical protein
MKQSAAGNKKESSIPIRFFSLFAVFTLIRPAQAGIRNQPIDNAAT